MNLLNTREAAERLGVSVVRVRQMIRAGKIEAQSLGRDYAINESSLASVTVYGKPGRPPLTEEEKAARASERAVSAAPLTSSVKPKATKKSKGRKAAK